MRADGKDGVFVRFARSRQGGVAAIFVLLAPVLIAFVVGMGVEIGLWYSVKRHLQTVVDEAALSGALEIGVGPLYGKNTIYPTAASLDASICRQARRTAEDNGFSVANTEFQCTQSPSCTGVSSTTSKGLCVNVPPLFGHYASPGLGGSNTLGPVEVVAWTPFSPISFFMPQVAIATRAVAGPTALPAPCLLALGYYPTTTSTTTIGYGGSGSAYGVTAAGATTIAINCSVASYPPIPASISVNGVAGTGASVEVSALLTAGQILLTNNAKVYLYGQSPTPAPQYPNLTELPPDPFGCHGADPTVSADSTQNANCDITYTAPPDTTCVNAPLPGPGNTGTLSPLPLDPVTLKPQYYCPMDIQGNVTLTPGVYVINGSDPSGYGLKVENNATLTSVDPTTNKMEPVTIILTGTGTSGKASAGGLNFNASGGNVTCPENAAAGGGPVSVCLIAPTTDNTFPGYTVPSGWKIPAGLLIYQDPRFVARNNLAANGAKQDSDTSSATVYLSGAIYAPGTNIHYGGGGVSGCTLVIAASINFSGGSQGLTNVNCQKSLKQPAYNARLLE